MFIQNGQSQLPRSVNFGFVNNIPTGSGSYFEVDSYNYSTAAFYINPLTGGNIGFQATFDGINYDGVTFRQMGNDGYSQQSDGPANYVGSVVGAKRIRFLNISGSTSSGTVMGTLNQEVSILEGIEHSNPPHKFGNSLFHLGLNISGLAFSNSGLFFPRTDHKFAVTYLSMSVASTQGAFITFHEGSGTASDPSQWVFSTYIKAATTDTQFVNALLNTPFVATNLKSGLFLTVEGGTATIRGVVHGYETEN